jgi:hypothetical protein
MRHGGWKHRRHGFGPGGPGFGGPRFRRRFNREAMLEYLEEYQRDLEQELADVSDLIKRLQDAPQQAGSEPAAQV